MCLAGGSFPFHLQTQERAGSAGTTASGSWEGLGDPWGPQPVPRPCNSLKACVPKFFLKS